MESVAVDIRIENMDCLDLLKSLPGQSIDLMLQDPPYSVTQNEWDVEINLVDFWVEWMRTIKDNGAMIFFSQQPFTSKLLLSNPGLFRYDLIWYKPLGSGFLNAAKMPMRNHEHLLVFYKRLPVYNPQMGVGIRKKGFRSQQRTSSNYGKFANDGMQPFDDFGKRFPQSVIEITNGDRTTENFHPTQKPVDLIRYLIRTYSNENDLVFDGFLGSGTTAEACVIEKRRFVGCDIHEEYYKYSVARIAQSKMIKRLF